MGFDFRRIKPEEAENFYTSFEGQKTFLQHPRYGAFRSQVGELIFYYGIFENEILVGTVLIQKIKTRLKTFLHVPHGPLFQKEESYWWAFFLEAYKKLGREMSCDFVRISPLLLKTETTASYFKKALFRPAPVHLVNPERTWVLDLQQSEADTLAHMRKSTRYEVRRIEKVGITVEMGNEASHLEGFWELHEATVARQGFVPFPKKNTEIQLEVFGENCQIFSSFFEQKIYSSCVIIFDNKAGYYHQGASQPHKLPVAHAPLWAAILEAKRRGCSVFNFWGVVEDDQKKHPWFGLSRFKRGFGGLELVFIHAQDFPITKKYWLNFLLEKWRKWRKGY